ncbi:MAG: hypothetical protein GF315_14320 [candidate division Zixibacteria bacterium]|nr:hypothetical protein [candidate division Zixibacteria bacterium]
MGMALDESKEGLKELESNGITAYIDPVLYEQVKPAGDIKIEYVDDPLRGKGFQINIGNSGGCSC